MNNRFFDKFKRVIYKLPKLQKKSEQNNYLLEGNGIAEFVNFCEKNKFLLCSTFIVLIFTYGLLVFHATIGVDTELAMTDAWKLSDVVISQGRFGVALLDMLFFIGRRPTPYSSLVFTMCFMYLASIIWSYLFSVFSKKYDNTYLVLFVLLFLTSTIWTEQFYFSLTAAAVSFAILLCPIIILLLYKGLLENKIFFIILSIALTTLVFSIYQINVSILLSGIGICFILFEDNSSYTAKYYYILALKICLCIALSGIIYFLINWMFINRLFSEYHRACMQLTQSFADRIISIISIAKYIFVDAVKETIYGKQLKLVYGSVALLPLTIIYIYQIYKNALKFPINKRILYLFVGAGVPLSSLLIPICLGVLPPVRTTYVISLIVAFLPLYLINSQDSKILKRFIAGIMLIVVVYQFQVSVQLQYFDLWRYNNDVKIAHDINKTIKEKFGNKKDFHLAFVGKEDTRGHFSAYPVGEMVGRSLFEINTDSMISGQRITSFMQCLGITKYSCLADEDEINEAYEMSESMPCYPQTGYIQKHDGVVVVKLSDSQNVTIKRISSNIRSGGDIIGSCFFSRDTSGWVTHNASISNNGNSGIKLKSFNVNPYIVHNVTPFKGKDYRYILIKYKILNLKKSGYKKRSEYAHIYYTTKNHGYSELYSAIQFCKVSDEEQIVLFDMSARDDWNESVITNIRLDLGATPNTDYVIDYVYIGK
ncbi:MAG: glucosyltransferase domain-containing protein [Endomicrobium sp.]|nr:glucosyltransferase domain-containing protein [Endomicrobium sp.]